MSEREESAARSVWRAAICAGERGAGARCGEGVAREGGAECEQARVAARARRSSRISEDERRPRRPATVLVRFLRCSDIAMSTTALPACS